LPGHLTPLVARRDGFVGPPRPRDGYVGAGSHGGTFSLVGCDAAGYDQVQTARVRSRRPFGSGCTARTSLLGSRTRPVRGALRKRGGMTLILTPILTPTVDPTPGARGGPGIPRPSCGPGRGPRPGCRRGFSAQPSHSGHPRATLL